MNSGVEYSLQNSLGLKANTVKSLKLKNIYFFSILMIIPAISMAEFDIRKAMGFYKEQKYDHAANLLLNNLSDINNSSTVVKLKSALIFSKNLKLYQDIYIKSKINQKTYLNTLVNEDLIQSSQYAKLYLAEIHILNNELTEAKKLLKIFSKNIPPTNTYYQISEIYSAWIAYLENNKPAYEAIINSIDRSNPILDLAVHFIEILLTGKTNDNTNKIALFEKSFIKENAFISTRFANYAIRQYVHQNNVMSAVNVLIHLDQRRPSLVEKISNTKILRFYDITLSDTIAELYYTISKSLLEDVSKNEKYHDLAIFYLSELDLVRLHKNSAEKYWKAVDKLRRLPKSLSSLREIRSTTHGYLIGQTSRAFQAWEEAVNNFKNDPAPSADAVLMCLYLDAKCPQIVQVAQLSAENGRSKRFEALSTNVGRYFLSRQKNATALRLLESAMDRSNTTSMLANEAILLLNYADALRLNKNYADSLQIYFSLGENFPIMRQIQEAVQGEYLFRQRSSGTTNVF